MSDECGISKVDIPAASGVSGQSWSAKKLFGLLAVFGPAAIVASVSIGAGETIVVVRAGAWAKYGLLWLVLLSCIVKGIFVTYLLGRYTAVSGENIGQRLVRLPGPRGWFLITIIVLELVGAPLAWVPIAKPCGDLFHFLFQGFLPQVVSEGIWENIITSVFIALALTMGLRLSFERLEKQQLVICGILVVGTIIGTLMVRPDLGEAFKGSVRFGYLPDFPSWAPADAVKNTWLTMSTAFAYVGGSVMGYIVYANWVGIKGWGLAGHEKIDAIRRRASTRDRIDYLPEDPGAVSRLRLSMSPVRWDVGMGAVALFIVTSAFLMSGAAVLYPLETEFEGWSLLTEQRHVWSRINPALVWVYYICIISALWGTLQAFPEIYGRVIHEFFGAIWPDRRWDRLKIQRVVCVYIFVTTLLIVWSKVKFDILTQIAGFCLSNLPVAMVMFAALHLNAKLPRVYQTRPLIMVGGVISALILTFFAVISGWGLVSKIFGV